MAQRLDFTKPGFEEEFRALIGMKREAADDIEAVVATILREVAERGDEALIEYTLRFDKLELSAATLRVSEAEIEAAIAACPREALDALAFARERIEAFHFRQRPKDDHFTDALGVRLGLRWTPIEAVGPLRAGRHGELSLLRADERRAGEGRRRPAHRHGRADAGEPAEPARARGREARRRRRGLSDRRGAGHRGARLRHGIRSRPSPRSSGPATPMWRAAKRRVFGLVGIDSIAGPSEVLVLADKTANPDWVALDLLAQAEHDGAAQSILITDDAALAEAVENRVALHLAELPRAAIARASWRDFGAVILVPSLPDAVASRRPPGARASRDRDRGSPRSSRASSAMRARSFSGITRPKPSAIMSAGRTMCCRRRAPRGSLPALASSIS